MYTERSNTTGNSNKRIQVKISNTQVLPSKLKVDNLICGYQNKMQLGTGYGNKQQTFKNKCNSQENRQSKSSLNESPIKIKTDVPIKNRRSKSVSNSSNPNEKIIVLQNIVLKSPKKKKTDHYNIATNESNDATTKEIITKFTTSILQDECGRFMLKHVFKHLDTRPPHSAPPTSSTKFDFDLNSEKPNSFFDKEAVDIEKDEVDNNTLYYVKNKLFVGNKNVKIKTTTNVPAYTLRFDKLNEANKTISETISTISSVSSVDIDVDKNKGDKQKNGEWNLHIDEYDNRVGHRECHSQKIGKSNIEEVNHYENSLSSKYVSSPFNEAFFTNSSIILTDIELSTCNKNFYGIRDNHKRNKLQKKEDLLKLPYAGDIFNTVYLDDIFQHIRTMEHKMVLHEKFLRKLYVDKRSRSEIVNWMLKIQQTSLYFSDSEFYLAVNMLDRVLGKVYVPLGEYQLLAMSTIWIATKVIGSGNLTVSVLTDLNKEIYSNKELLKMEQNVLKVLNFEIHTAEPSICLEYYLKHLKIDNNDLGRLSAFYALDFFALLPEFSSTPMSLVAAAVMSFVLNVYREYPSQKGHSFFNGILSKEEINKVEKLENLLYNQFKNMTDENYLFKEPYKKYEHESLMSISKYMREATFPY